MALLTGFAIGMVSATMFPDTSSNVGGQGGQITLSVLVNCLVSELYIRLRTLIRRRQNQNLRSADVVLKGVD